MNFLTAVLSDFCFKTDPLSVKLAIEKHLASRDIVSLYF